VKQRKRYKRGRNFIAKARNCEESSPEVLAAMERGKGIVKELDPLLREALRDAPAALAEWEDIMREFHNLEEEDSKDSGSSRDD